MMCIIDLGATNNVPISFIQPKIGNKDFFLVSFDNELKIVDNATEETSYLKVGLSSALEKIIPIMVDSNLSHYQYLELGEGNWEILSGSSNCSFF